MKDEKIYQLKRLKYTTNQIHKKIKKNIYDKFKNIIKIIHTESLIKNDDLIASFYPNKIGYISFEIESIRYIIYFDNRKLSYFLSIFNDSYIKNINYNKYFYNLELLYNDFLFKMKEYNYEIYKMYIRIKKINNII